MAHYLGIDPTTSESKPSGCAVLTKTDSARLWTGTLEPSFDMQVFQGIVVYGGDRNLRMGNAGEVHRFFCCKALSQ